MSYLQTLEDQSIYIFREAFANFKNMAMPWSMGKDSNTLIWLAKKAFAGKIPFPLVHIDTTYEFPEMLAFREWARKHYEIDLIVIVNEEARKRGVGYETHDPVTVTHELKSLALQQALAKYKWDALVTGIRRDEDATRAKERYFSPRTADNEWEYRDQPPEFWGQFTTAVKPGEHTNYSASAATISVNLVTAAGSAANGNLIVKTKTLQASETYTFPELVGHVLAPSGFISTIAGTASAINIRASGREVT